MTSLEDVKGLVIDEIEYDEDDETISIIINNPDTKELFRSQFKPVGRYCDNLWLSYSIEKID